MSAHLTWKIGLQLGPNFWKLLEIFCTASGPSKRIFRFTLTTATTTPLLPLSPMSLLSPLSPLDLFLRKAKISIKPRREVTRSQKYALINW
jgi:hypothetical protein